MDKAKILIVEDEAIIAMEIESQLQDLGYEVTSIVDTGEKAIKKAEEEKPDLILMDIRIKGEMDGIDAAAEIRNRFDIPVIFSTAYLDEERIERAKITMPFGYVLKPIQERDLKVTLEMASYVTKVDAERRKTEVELMKSENRLNRSEKIGKIGNYEYDLVTGEIIWSDQVFELYERDPEIGPPSDGEVGNYYSEEDHMRLRGYIQKIIEAGDSVENFECPVNLPSGRTLIFIGSMFPIKDIDGTVIKIYGVLQDISKRKQAEEVIRKNEEKFRLLYERAPLSYQSLDENGCFVAVNDAWLKTLGYSIEEVIGKSFGDFIHPEWSDYFKENFPRFKNLGEIIGVEFQMVKKDGSLILVSFDGRIGLNEDSGFRQMHCIFKDVTSQRQLEENLRESEEKHRTLFETMVLGVVYQDAGGNITDANPAAERILGLSLSQMQGRTALDPRWKAIHEDGSDFPGETHPGMVALKTCKEVNNIVMGVFHPQKEEHRWININAVPKFREGESTPYENYATFDDITDLIKGKK
ncbi:MAG: PAS domain S-box protein [Calditrichaeota bacterium]|jgi:PAS domain S-box-containing protein|nr:PAS domain S-box protein [Deltaproteobacteria bacterium]MBT7616771.1 PAS domain S-box protein [Calditrichota bacterium]